MQRHLQLDEEILKNRKVVYEKAKEQNPNRWSDTTRNWDFINEVHLNPGKVKKKEKNTIILVETI